MLAKIDLTAAGKKHTRAELLQILEACRVDAAEAVRVAIPRNAKIVERIPGVHQSGVSRAKNGDPSNPIYRLMCWILALHRAGLPRERAEIFPVALEVFIEQLWGQLGDERELSCLEQLAEAEETKLQLRLAGGDESVVEELLVWQAREIAAQRAFMSTLRRRLLAASGRAA